MISVTIIKPSKIKKYINAINCCKHMSTFISKLDAEAWHWGLIAKHALSAESCHKALDEVDKRCCMMEIAYEMFSDSAMEISNYIIKII